MRFSSLFVKFLGALLCVLLSNAVNAQAKYPDRPLRIVVPFPAGVSPDVVARILGDKLSQAWGQPVVIDNRPGASGAIGAEVVAKSQGDGYTLLMAANAIMSMNPHIYPKLSYDPLKDFKPVTHILNVPFVLTAAGNTPFDNLRELVDEARKNPGKINYATLGAGSYSHVAMEWLMNRTQTKMHHVPYKGSPLNDMMGGSVALYLDPLVTAQPLVSARKVKALGVTSASRSPVMPDVPTFSELGYPGIEAHAFQGIYVPVGTPDQIVSKLNEELTRIIRLPDVQKKLLESGYIPVASTPAELAKLTRDDHAFWGKLIRQNNIRLE